MRHRVLVLNYVTLNRFYRRDSGYFIFRNRKPSTHEHADRMLVFMAPIIGEI